jgi:GNAT superfamily N-acetyltransferase
MTCSAGWPEYNHHGDFAGQYFGALVPRFARLQILVSDVERDCLVARARTIPFAWNGSLDDLPAGIDALGLRAIDAHETPTVLSALAAEVAPGHQRRGLSRVLLRAMTRVAGQAGLSPLVAPVRPSHKHRYALAPIEEYASWRGTDGLPSDPCGTGSLAIAVQWVTRRSKPETARSCPLVSAASRRAATSTF